MRTPILPWFLVLVLQPMLLCQADAAQRSFGVSRCDGELLAGGPGYSVLFTADGPEYRPLLGAAAAGVPATVQFTFLEARRGEVIVAHGGAVPPSELGVVVSYPRDATVERYEARVDGVEQSFVFDRRPAGHGDLVVRGRLRTSLPLASVGDEGVRFHLPGVGGVTLGAVTGVDARGAVAGGSVRLQGDVLELSLPSAFVDGATYPLVLDPLFGTSFPIGDVPGEDDRLPAIAYDTTSSRYLVVWCSSFSSVSGSHHEVRAQLVAQGGALVGNQLLIANDVALGAPGVASVNPSNRFLVAWEGLDSASNTNGLLVRSVVAATGAMSNAVLLRTSGALNRVSPGIAVGGESRLGALVGSNALVAYRTQSTFPSLQYTIAAQRVTVPANGDPVGLATVNLVASASTSYLSTPVVTADGGSAGRWMVAYGSGPLPVLGNAIYDAIVGHIVDSSGSLCSSAIQFLSARTAVAGPPAIATRDGNEFVAAWGEQGTSADALRLRRAVCAGACGSLAVTLDPAVSPVPSAFSIGLPSVAFVRDRYLVAWRQSSGVTNEEFRTLGIDPATCTSCGVVETVYSSASNGLYPKGVAVGSRWSGGDAASESALVAWQGATGISGRLWTLHSTPSIVGLGGDCGVSGFNDFASYNGLPQLGNASFAVQLANPTAPVLALVVGFSQNPTSCGPCTLVPSADVLITSTGTVPIPLPCSGYLVGVDLYTQWLQIRPGGCPMEPNIGLSNTLRFTITE